MEFYKCNHCGNIIEYVENKGVRVFCCGEMMSKLEPNTTDAAQEKHVPEVTINGNEIKVVVGSVMHPMTEEHHISWIAIETEQGYQRKELKVNENPEINFAISNTDKLKNVYAYCNLHGLWKKEF